jgi:hypothetical protein
MRRSARLAVCTSTAYRSSEVSDFADARKLLAPDSNQLRHTTGVARVLDEISRVHVIATTIRYPQDGQGG